MKCPQCGHQNAKHYKFCLECGAEIPSTSSDSPIPSPVKSKRVGIADAFDSKPLKNPSPETLIRQVEDLSSDIGLNTPLSSPITTPPMSNLKDGLQNPLLAKKDEKELVISSALMASKGLADQKLMNSGLLQKSGSQESEGINFHTSLSSGRDSLASFEGEFFGELEAARAMSISAELPEESAPPPIPSPEESLSDPAVVPVKSLSPPKVAIINCHSCGAEVPKDYLFCGRCGAKMEQAVESPEAESSEAESLEVESPEVESPEVESPVVESPVVESSKSDLQAHENIEVSDKLEAMIEETPVIGIASIPPMLQPPIVESAVAVVDALGVATGGALNDQLNNSLEESSESKTFVELVHIHLDGSEGESIHINDHEYLIGKDHEWAVFNTDDYLSDRHAQLEFTDDGKVLLKDLGGVNGVFLRLTRPTKLKHGDYFRAGQQLFAFENLSTASSSDQDGTKKLGSPQYDAWGRLVHIIGQGEVGRAWLLHNSEILLGRVKGEIVFDQDRFMSGKHCTVSCEQDQTWLSDQGSTNGSFIRIREQVVLENDDLILLGQKIFRVKFI